MTKSNPNLRPDELYSEVDGKPEFEALLVPHRSLGRSGFIILMVFVSFSCITSGVFFLLAGAWPVMITMGLDVLAIWIAFKLNYRSGRIYEEIKIWPHQVLVRKVSPSGKAKEHMFNPFWVKFDVDRHVEYGVMAMKLREKGRVLELGSFLNPTDRKSFSFAFSAALASVRR